MTSYKSLEEFIDYSNNNKIDKIIKNASKLDCNTLETNTFMHKTLHKIKDNLFKDTLENNIDLYQTIIKVEDYFKYTPNVKDDRYYNNILKNMDCGIYRYSEEIKDYEWNFEYLVPNICDSMDNNNIVFIILDFEDFGLDCNNEYEAHSTVLLFLPNNTTKKNKKNKKNKKKYFNYNCYYINSHGINSLDDKFYEYKISSKRKKKKKLEKPFDSTFVELLVQYLNKNTNNKIKYTEKNNYLGVNLQASDTRGVCFMFPIVIYYYFCKYYFNERTFNTEWGNITIKKGEELIKNNNLNIFVESMFVDFCPEYKLCLLQELKNPKSEHVDILTSIIEDKKILYCKIILRALIKFLSQFK